MIKSGSAINSYKKPTIYFKTQLLLTSYTVWTCQLSLVQLVPDDNDSRLVVFFHFFPSSERGTVFFNLVLRMRRKLRKKSSCHDIETDIKTA